MPDLSCHKLLHDTFNRENLKMFDFFISHSSVDKHDIVDELVQTIRNMGYSVWYDKNEILVGDDISTKVQKGLSEAYCLILVITNNFMKSKWTFYETGFFDNTKNNRIIPLIYGISNSNVYRLKDILGNRKYIDMNKVTKEDAASDLVRSLHRTKLENHDLHTVEQLNIIQRKLASHETLNSGTISIKIKEYLVFLKDHTDYLSSAAQKIVTIVVIDLLNHAGYKIDNADIDSATLLSLLTEQNIGSINFREYVDYIFRPESQKNVHDIITITNRALLNIMTFYIHTQYPFDISFSSIEVVFPDELTYMDFEDMFEIDNKVMRKDLVASVQTTFGWFEHNKYTHIAVRDISTQKIIGYFSVLPITEEIYNKIICGDFKDKDFTPDSIEQYIFSNFYRIYVAGVGIDPEYQNTGAFIKLYNALIDLFLFLAKEREIYISEILAEASTKQGEKFCKMVGMKKISSTTNDTDIYRLVTIPPEFSLKNNKGKELYELCKNTFEEYRDYFENK